MLGLSIYNSHQVIAEEKFIAPDDVYRARYMISGYLVRAGAVCDIDAKRMIELGLQFISSAELRSVAQAFPATTQRWMTEGADRFNSEVIKGGIKASCNSALATSKQAASAVQIVHNEPVDEAAKSQIEWMRLTDSFNQLKTSLYSVVPGGRWGLLFIVLSVYFLPATIAINRDHYNAKAIGAVNLVLGWTILGWLFAFLWAWTRPSIGYRDDVLVRREPHL
jgi:Superinfection immunity protein